MSDLFGIDVSHHNGVIDWKKVKAAGVSFAILKCMYEAQSHRIDEQFEANYKGCWENQIETGVYIFIASASIKDPVADAEALIRHLDKRYLPYGIWLDLESDVLRAQGGKKISELAYLYAEKFKAAGHNVGIYCNVDWYNNVILQDLKKDFYFWIARYPKADDGLYHATSKLKPNMQSCVAWQYSSKGHVPGIKTNVDMDIDFYGNTKGFIGSQTIKHKSNEEIAQEVWDNKWGTAKTKPTRRELLTRAGYDYEAIQKIVTSMKR